MAESIGSLSARSDSSYQASSDSTAPSYNASSSLYPSYSAQQEQSVQQPQAQPVASEPPVQEETQNLACPYIPVIRPIKTEQGQQAYILSTEEIQKMLQQNAFIIKKLINDVHNGSSAFGIEQS